MKPNTKAILVTANGCCRPVLLDDIEDIYKSVSLPTQTSSLTTRDLSISGQ